MSKKIKTFEKNQAFQKKSKFSKIIKIKKNRFSKKKSKLLKILRFFVKNQFFLKKMDF